MKFALENVQSELTDEFEGIEEFVGIYSGDIYRSQRPFGYFVASIYPQSKAHMAMLVSAVNTEKYTLATIAVLCEVGVPDVLLPVEPASLPWGDDDGVLFCNHISPDDYKDYSISTELLEAARCIVSEEPGLKDYVKGEFTQ